MRTHYVIRLTTDGRYYAERFEFMTTATVFALTELGLNGGEFTVEAV